MFCLHSVDVARYAALIQAQTLNKIYNKGYICKKVALFKVRLELLYISHCGKCIKNS
ncbi:hypothetical protein [Anaerobutyricum hallii]|uniref:hypothetical protein n=1 Tax=Anaerobutyricum hallii TaxID=39488 RepID=UPI002FE6F07F